MPSSLWVFLLARDPHCLGSKVCTKYIYNHFILWCPFWALWKTRILLMRARIAAYHRGYIIRCKIVHRTRFGPSYIFDDGDESLGFSVVRTWCFDGLSPQHEFGHNLGCSHNREISDTTTDYGYGYRNCDVDNRCFLRWNTLSEQDTKKGVRGGWTFILQSIILVA